MDEIKLFLLSIGTATLLLFIPYMIYTDIKSRTVSHDLFYFIACANLVPTFMLYWFGILTPLNAIDNAIVTVIIFLIWKKFGSGAFSAADRNLLILIVWLFVWVPGTPITPTTYFADIAFTNTIQFLAYFMMVCMFVPGFLFAYNYIVGRRSNILQMLTYYPRGIPFVVPIAVAFSITLVMV